MWICIVDFIFPFWWFRICLKASGILVIFAASILCLHIASLNPSDKLSWEALVKQYKAFYLLGEIQGKRVLEKLPKMMEMCSELQETILLEILQGNADTIYGREKNFSNIKSVKDFKSLHSLTTYKDYELYMSKVLKDEPNILFKEPVLHIGISSGTSGKNKHFPINSKLASAAVGALYLRTFKRRATNQELKRILAIKYKPNVKYTPNGTSIAPLSYVSVPHQPFYVSPECVFDITDERSALYVHAVLGMADREIICIDGLMASFVYSFFKEIETKWREMCDDIERGEITTGLKIEEELRREINSYLVPDPARAEEVREACCLGPDRLVRRIWPHCVAVSMISTGGFTAHTNSLKATFLRDVIVHSPSHGASEGLVGLAISDNVNEALYSLLPNLNFMEFIPEEVLEDEQPETVLLHQLERGRSYEVVLTTRCGLYRYRLGDVIKIVDFYKGCPQYEFCYRIGQMLNVSWEKTPESVFYSTLVKTLAKLQQYTLEDYTATESLNLEAYSEYNTAKTKHYVLFIEVKENVTLSLPERKRFDEVLRQEFELYDSLRANGSIDEMKLVQIHKGGFGHLKEHILEGFGSLQFKMPRVLRKQDQLDVLLQNAIKD